MEENVSWLYNYSIFHSEAIVLGSLAVQTFNKTLLKYQKDFPNSTGV